ncbi:HEAT repeat domain-containing protein [Rhodothermus profundi]|uniref:HEAT repeat-containing protein n=1 Tax=Rhodothermus profundi TaxID=633813 RepID=A0A1M6PYL1_9BACT|nr:HEAT repeat domain-containing protein [Rhodothermus profundi]SHK12946.1 HEAT repeat-containing protein [Rhodothermus profundi]
MGLKKFSQTSSFPPETVEDDLIALQEALQDPNPARRRQAVRRLADVPEGLSYLMAHLEKETDVSVLEVLLQELVRAATPEARAALVQGLRSDQATLRNATLDALRQHPDQAASLVEQLLQDPDPDVRILTLSLLGTLALPQTETWLIQVLEHDPHVNVCAAAIDLLCEVGTEAARPALEAARRRFANEPYVQFAVKQALRRIGGEA